MHQQKAYTYKAYGLHIDESIHRSWLNTREPHQLNALIKTKGLP